VGILLLFGAVMAFLAGTSLLWRGTVLDGMWVLNPRAYQKLERFGRAVGIPFLLLGITLCLACIGWFRQRVWGWRLTVILIATQVLGNVLNILSGHFVEGGIGVTIAGGLLVYLLRADVKGVFGAGPSDN
jgi:hypothetical protein